MKSRTLMIYLSAVVMLSAQAFGQAIVLDSVGTAGLFPGTTDMIRPGQLIHFYFRFNNNTSEDILGFSNGFRIYSTDGAQWTTASIDTPVDASARGWGGAQFHEGSGRAFMFRLSLSADGQLSDSVAFAGLSLASSSLGAAAGSNDIAAIITIGPIPFGPLYDQKHICIDSSWLPVGWDWLWGTGTGEFVPDWGGPYCFTVSDEATGVDDNTSLPSTFSLSQNYPNPFNPTTHIDYSLAEKSHVELSVYNVLGQKIRTLIGDKQAAGSYSESWDGSSSDGRPVASGIYFYRITTEKFTSTKKMMLVK